MKILLIANCAGGLYKFRAELLMSLLQVHEVYISVPYGRYVDHLKEMGCKFEACEFDRHGTNPAKELRQITSYIMLIKRLHPDIVLSYTIKPNVYGGIACAHLHVPYVANITGLGTAVENGGIMQKITLPLYKYGLRRAQMVFFQNPENRDFMVSHQVIKGPYKLLPGSGVNLARHKLLEYPTSDTIDFVFIARIMQEKGIEQFLDAAKYIRPRYPNTRFHVCGFCEQDYNERLEALKNEGIIIYHGSVDDVDEIHRISFCTVLPTFYPEGMSNVLLESCACGRPIITTNRPGCREIVEDGVNGFVVKQRDSEDLIDKIEKFIRLPREQKIQMGLNGRAKVERQFDRSIVVNAYLEEIEKANNNGL